MPATGRARQNARARERHRELRYCAHCGLKSRQVGDLCPRCSRPLTARTKAWQHKPNPEGLLYAQRGERTAVRMAARIEDDALTPQQDSTLYYGWLGDQPGYPLGPGMPMGSPLRLDGESHSNAWRRILRGDPCAYCGTRPAGTVDHVHPRSRRTRDTERWPNLVGACPPCNTGKAAKPLLLYLLSRRDARPQSADVGPAPPDPAMRAVSAHR